MLPLTKKEERQYKKKNSVTYAKKSSMKRLMKIKTIVRSRITFMTQKILEGSCL